MFLGKDVLDDEGESAPMRRPPSSAGYQQSGGYQSRPSSSAGRPMTATTSLGSTAPPGAVDDGDSVGAPASVQSMRAKMLQQRQKALAKQRTGTLATGSLISASSGHMPPDSSPQPVASPVSLAGSTSPSGKTPLLGGSMTSASSFGLNLLPQAGSPTSAIDDDRDADSPRTPTDEAKGPDAPPISKEEERRRRQNLTQELEGRGICPVFDPKEAAGYQSSFDVASVAPENMKAFLHSPVPKHAAILQCRIIRDRSGISNKLHPKYVMVSDSGVFLMSAQKQTKNKTSNYSVTMSKSKEADGFLGKLRSDFLGIEWVAYGPGLNPSKIDSKLPANHAIQLVRQELCAIQYTSSKWGAGAKGPRKMCVVLPHVQPSGERIICQTLQPQTEGLCALREGANASQRVDSYVNKPPKWNDQIGAYVLNFNKRVTEASVKNFQLINAEDPETVYLQFGRVGKEDFNLDFRHPLSPFQAFAMCLSSFDYKLGCE
mmetsp:Transcript_63430/g.163221  ORF Transcript_63430/g.163221 Transcript_63430/m.163221 type:complete len:488 (-) Transcript_63430:132-1595(-)